LNSSGGLPNERRLTGLRQRGGGDSTSVPGLLFPLLAGVPSRADPRVLAGRERVDGAAIVNLTDDVTVLSAADFSAPIVDDPFEFGRIAAASALSSIYAMGGRPVCALHLCGLPIESLGAETCAHILAGGAAMAREAGLEIAGGHMLQAGEPFYGLAVTGAVHPDKMVRNSTGKPGDRLILTKPLGLGIVASAAARDRDSLGALGEAIAIMTTLNAAAARALAAVSVHAATGVSAFGLLGHLRGLARASGLSARVVTQAVPVLDAARRYVTEGLVPSETHENWRQLQPFLSFAANVSKAEQLLLSDAQLSGGLLIAVPPHLEGDLLAVLRAEGTLASAVIGELVSGDPGAISVSA
jgi:selenide, water dikinase